MTARRGIMRSLARPIRLFPPGLGEVPADLIAAADLPAPLADLITTVITRARLWHSERLDVARELIAHVRDGLNAGRAAEELARSFGEPAHTARLIRRAKKRCRPLAWRALMASLKATGLLLGACIVLYVALAARVFLTHPTISRNYTAELNDRLATIPEADRAWPLYRQAYLTQPRMPDELAKDFPAFEPADPLWPAAVAYLEDLAPTLALVRRAAAMPALAHPISAVPDPEIEIRSRWLAGMDEPKARAEVDALTRVTDPNPPLIAILLPHLGYCRQFGKSLALDARVAAECGDAPRAAADLDCLLRMSAHLREDRILISGLVALAVHALATDTFGRLLFEKPDLFTDDQLATLAHSASRLDVSLALDGERLFMADTLQRTYTDDGSGDGHITADGFRTLGQFVSIDGRPAFADLDVAVLPARSAIVASRREVADLYNRMIADVLAFAALPPWQRSEITPDYAMERLVSGTISRQRHFLISLLMPALTSAVVAGDSALQRRDGVLVAVAAELFRRRQGAYPATLTDIPGSLLPQTPRDLFDGNALRYTLRDGRPLIYSIGCDRKDDGGRPPSPGGDRTYSPGRWLSASHAADLFKSGHAESIDGDWILWPPTPPARSPN